jgi:hypothetical protein
LGTDTFSEFMDEGFENIINLKMRYNVKKFIYSNSITQGGQTLKNSTLKLNNTGDD